MTIVGAIGFWLSSFAQVFLLGFQSRNVNSGRYAWAGATSFAITALQVEVIRTLASGDAVTVIALAGTSGPAGIMAAMYVHCLMEARKDRRA